MTCSTLYQSTGRSLLTWCTMRSTSSPTATIGLMKPKTVLKTVRVNIMRVGMCGHVWACVCVHVCVCVGMCGHVWACFKSTLSFQHVSHSVAGLGSSSLSFRFWNSCLRSNALVLVLM